MITCGHTARTVTEAGIILLTCTLPPHQGKAHYDSAFCLEWKEA